MNAERSNPEGKVSELEVTRYAKRSVQRVIRDPYFRDQDPELIFTALQQELKVISFGTYLKRVLTRIRAERPEYAGETDDLALICKLFEQHGTPASFAPTTARLRNLARNWLTQRSVNRSVVLLLGFGLGLTPEQVDELLTKGLREPRLDPKDPFEVICWYCYRYSFPYARMEELWRQVRHDKREAADGHNVLLDSTLRVRKKMETIASEAELKSYVSRLQLAEGSSRQSVSARAQFEALYKQTQGIAAEKMSEIARDEAARKAERKWELFSRNDRYYDFEKREKVQKEREKFHQYTAAEMTPADLENVLYSAVPKDKNGNLTPMKASALNDQFSGKRLNRQHITEILSGKAPISRFDLLTLCFLVTAEGEGAKLDIRKRYTLFVNQANQMLQHSYMEPLYLANPYESFLLMCMVCDDPLGTYADVWELSYEKES